MNASRVSKLRIGLLIFAGILLAKLFYIQIIDDRYKINASNNSMVYDIIYPTRGIIYDRNGKIIVGIVRERFAIFGIIGIVIRCCGFFVLGNGFGGSAAFL